MGLFLNDRLVLISNKFEYYFYCFAYAFIMFCFIVPYYSNKYIRWELCSRESFLDKIFLDGFNCRLFLTFNCLLASLLSKLAHSIGFSSFVVCWTIEDNKVFISGLSFVRHLGLRGLKEMWRHAALLRLEILKRGILEKFAIFGKMFLVYKSRTIFRFIVYNPHFFFEKFSPVVSRIEVFVTWALFDLIMFFFFSFFFK